MKKIKNNSEIILKGHWKLTLTNIKDGGTRIYEFDNIIPTVGRTMIADNLTNISPTNVMLVNYIALGTDDTAVDNADTTLGVEGYRNAVASRTSSTNTAYITGYFSATECDSTYYEAGIFCNGTGSPDTGILLSRVLLNAPTGIVKSNLESLTIDWSLVIN